MKRGLLCAFALLASLGIATDALACRVPRSAVARTVAEQDAYDLRSVGVAAIAAVTDLRKEPADFRAEFQTLEPLRGQAPGIFELGGDEFIVVTCYPQRHELDLIRNLQDGDAVLIFSLEGANIPFDIMTLDDPRAVRLLTILRSERTARP